MPAVENLQRRHAFQFVGETSAAQATKVTKAPDAVQVLPLPAADGMLLARDGRKVRVADLQALVTASNAEAAAVGRMPIDLDHELHDWWEPGGPASGWFTGWEVRADGVYATGIEWLERGREAFESRAYGFTSVTMEAEMVVLEQDPMWGYVTDYELRPVTLTGFALTNIPAMRNRAMFAKEDESMPKNPAILAMFAALGLQASATPEAAAEAAAGLAADNKKLREQLAEAAAPKADTYVPRSEFDRLVAERDGLKAALEAAAVEKRKAEIDSVMDEFADRIPPSMREFYRRSAEAIGLDEFRRFAAAIPAIAGANTKLTKLGESTGLSEAERSVAKQMGITEQEFVKAKHKG